MRARCSVCGTANVQPAIDNQTNLTIQHQFAGNTTLQVGYVGQIANHLMVPFKYNQLVYVPGGTPQPSLYFQNGIGPQLAAAIDSTGGTVSGTQSNGRMMYNALQAVLQKTMSKGLQGQVSYTFSKCMTNNSGYYGTWSGARGSNTASPYWQNVYDPGAEWAPCYYDCDQHPDRLRRLRSAGRQGRQFGNDMNRSANAIVGGWTVSPILSLAHWLPDGHVQQRRRSDGNLLRRHPAGLQRSEHRFTVGKTPQRHRVAASSGSILQTTRTTPVASAPALRNLATCEDPATITGTSACRRTSSLRKGSGCSSVLTS